MQDSEIGLVVARVDCSGSEHEGNWFSVGLERERGDLYAIYCSAPGLFHTSFARTLLEGEAKFEMIRENLTVLADELDMEEEDWQEAFVERWM